MPQISIDDVIRYKNLTPRQEIFVKKLIERGGTFNNNDLANIWEAQSFPGNFKKILTKDPKILILVKSRPRQIYKIYSEKSASPQQTRLASIEKKSQSKNTITSNQGNLALRIENLEIKIDNLEKKFNNLISPYKKIKLGEFKTRLYREYRFLNPNGDISGVDYETLKRRVTRILEISLEYFDDFISDLKNKEHLINLQVGREKKYIHIKLNLG